MAHLHTNDLIHESSPYLLQHAHNPVQWRAWSHEALQLAKQNNKPILISIGYSACHWCHVMERESFENEDVAAVMNEHFINIKIDREERPDLDHIYMESVQLMTGSGGWPLNVFLTPDGKPFFGGTYFPPRRMHQRMSWLEVLHAVNDLWTNRRDEVEEQADKLFEHMRSGAAILGKKNIISDREDFFSEDAMKKIADQLMSHADKTYGGFGKAPKFPQTFSLQYLLMYGHFKKDQSALEHALLSIRSMIQGGLYDQLGGGFARYSTDDEWLAPHFEKMLYDNALLIGVMSEAYMISKDPLIKKAIEATIAFCENELKAPSGGYYSAIDADSEGEEGKYYVWTAAALKSILGELAPYCKDYFGVTQQGNWEGHNILTCRQETSECAAKHQLSLTAFEAFIEEGRKKLLTARAKRIKPSTDHKIIAGWNALYLTALCKASMALQNNTYADLAVSLCKDMIVRFTVSGEMRYHVNTNDISAHAACLDDLACFIQALIHLQELTGDAQYLEMANRLIVQAIEAFGDETGLMFYYTSKDQQDILYRKPDWFDGALPSGNAMMAENLYYLSVILDQSAWKERAMGMWAAMHTMVKQHPASFGCWATSMMKQHLGVKEVVMTGSTAIDLLPQLLAHYFPQKILQTAVLPLDFPLLHGKSFTEPISAYVCEDYQCQKTVYSLKEILKTFDELSTY